MLHSLSPLGSDENKHYMFAEEILPYMLHTHLSNSSIGKQRKEKTEGGGSHVYMYVCVFATRTSSWVFKNESKPFSIW